MDSSNYFKKLKNKNKYLRIYCERMASSTINSKIVKEIGNYITENILGENFEQDIVDQFVELWKNKNTQKNLLDIFINAKPKKNKTGYQMFIAEKKAEGIKVDEYRELWKQIKENEEELAKYKKLADEENGVESDDIKMPKKPRSAFILFSKDFRQVVLDNNPGIAPKEVTSKLGELWKQYKESEEDDDKEIMEKYKNMAEEDKERYKQEMEEVPEDAKIKKSVKRGKSAYNFFCSENRKQVKEDNPDSDPKEITAILGQLWKELKEEKGEEYEKYMDMQKEEKERVANSSDVEVDKNKVKRVTAYSIYCQNNRDDVRAENPELTPTEVNKKLSEMWKELKDDEGRAEELAEYEQMAAEKNGKSGKSVAKKSPAKKTTAKGTVAKSSVAKKTSVKGTVAKSSVAKGTTAKTTVSKSSVAKSSTAKSSTAKGTAAKTVSKLTSKLIKKQEDEDEEEDLENEDNDEEDNDEEDMANE